MTTTAEVLLLTSSSGGGSGLPAASLTRYRGHLCNLRDRSGMVIWTPALPGAAADKQDEWLDIIQANGGAHVPFGAFDGGVAYDPGDPSLNIPRWSNPDWRNDAASIRALTMKVINRGMVPVIFADNGERDPMPRVRAFFPVLAQALDGLDNRVLVVATGWEPEGYRAGETSHVLTLWHQLRPGSVIAVHGWPTRLVLSSNPVQADDPWQGGESTFYTSHGGEFINGPALYQTPHGRDLYRPCTCPRAAEKFGHEDACWLNRFEDYVARIGAGYHGWRVLPICLFETVAYEYFRGQATEQQARDIATAAQTVAAKWGVDIGFGNGLPEVN